MKFADLPKTYRPDLGVSGKGQPRKLEVENAVIRNTTITIADHDCLTVFVHVGMDGSAGSFGGFKLGRTDLNNMADGSRNSAVEFLIRVMQTVGVDTWVELLGSSVRILHEGLGGQIIAIGHFMNDEWFCPRVEWKEFE